jgi:AcrR family transcriptional regulator
VFAAMQRVMSRVGPADLTLDAIAREAGITAGALVQRFGSKRQMQVTLAKAAASWGPTFVSELRAQHRSPLAALRAYAECMAGLAETPAAFVRNLAYLEEDLRDPDLHAQLAKQGRATRDELSKLIDAAVDAKELVSSTNSKKLARTIEAVLSGSMMTWAFYREGTAGEWMRSDLDAVLAPYLVRPSRGQSRVGSETSRL